MTRKENKDFRKMAAKFRERFNQAGTLKELADIRDEFFKLPYSYERLDLAWDFVDGLKGNGREEISIEEILELRNDGMSSEEIAFELNVSSGHIRNCIKIYYGGKYDKNKSKKNDATISLRSG